MFYAGRHSEEEVKNDPAARISAPEEVLETEETAVAPNNVHYIDDIQNNSDINTATIRTGRQSWMKKELQKPEART